MNELNKDLRNQAIHLGLCNEWQKLWQKGWSKEKMVEMMFRGLDFCLKFHFPANEYILKHFDKDFLRNAGIFVNDKYSVLNPKQILILGTSDITIRYNTWNHGNIHIRDNSSLKLTARNRSFVIVHLYENASLTAEQFDKAQIVVIKHSIKANVIADKNVKVREELDYLK